MQPYYIGEVSEKKSFLSRETVPLNAVTFRWIPQVNWQNVHDEANYSDLDFEGTTEYGIT